MCFPGGRLEGAESPEECALRETWEELGIPREKIRILGRLDFIAHRANFILYPVLALVEEEAVDGLHLNPDEVAEVFQVPLEHLRNEPPLEYHYDLIPRPDENFPYELIGIPRDYRWQIGGEDDANLSLEGSYHLGADRANHPAFDRPFGEAGV